MMRNENGFTLLEILVAITVFAVGVIAAASMQSTSNYSNATARLISEQTQAGAGLTEQFMGLSFGYGDLGYVVPGTEPVMDMGPYEVSWRVQDDFPAAGCKLLTLRITGDDRGLVKTTTLHKVFVKGN